MQKVGLWTKLSLLLNVVLLCRLQYTTSDIRLLYSLPSLTSPTTSGNRPTQCRRDFVDPFRARHNYIAPTPRNDMDVLQNKEECGTSPDFTPFFAQGMNARSRLDEDKVIYNSFFRNSSIPHTYVEIGGFDGKTESNSRFFDVCLGWEGLLVEANPTTFQKLVANRPHAHKASFAASCSEEEARNNKTVGFHDAIFSNAAQVDTPNAEAYSGREKTPVQVPCGPLTSLLQDLFCGHVTFFSLDVEGAEPMYVSCCPGGLLSALMLSFNRVLESIDFQQVFVEVFIVENSNNFCTEECESRDKFRKILLQNDYSIFHNVVTKSDLFIHKRSQFRQAFS